MKKILYLICTCCTAIYAQNEKDPLVNTYRVGEHSEIFITSSSDRSPNPITHNIVKADTALQYSTITDTTYGIITPKRLSVAASGDLNLDGRDEVVSIQKISDNILITIPNIRKDLTFDGKNNFYDSKLNSPNLERIRICTGNFDNDLQKEFVVCSGPDAEGHLSVSLYETDSLLNIHLLDSFDTLAYIDPYFDIVSGNIDGDSLGDLVLIRNLAPPVEKTPYQVSKPVFISTYDLIILEYNPTDKKLEITKRENHLVTENKARDASDHTHVFMNDIRVSCGDLNYDTRDEIIVGLSIFYRMEVDNYEEKYFNTVFLHRIKFPKYKNITASSYYVATDYFPHEPPWERKYDVAFTLKCEQLFHLGACQVLVNSPEDIFVYRGFKEDSLERIAILSGYYNNNIRGGECFAVADINPDTAKMDFKKEILVLETELYTSDQILTTGSMATLLVYSQ